MTSALFIDDNGGLGRPKQRLMIAILLNELAGGPALPSEGGKGQDATKKNTKPRDTHKKKAV